MKWTEREDQILRKGARDGLSFRDVAALLGRSRNEVAGRANRLGVIFGVDGPRKKRIDGMKGARARWGFECLPS